MVKKDSTYLHRDDEAFEMTLEGMQHLRKQFLSMPFRQFVNSEKLWKSLPKNKELRKHLIRLDARLNFGTESFRYFMMYLRDAKTAEVVDEYESQRVHTDFRGRCEIDDADKALGYAMGFKELDEDLNVEALGYELDPGYVEETISTVLGDVQIFGCKNTKGNYHGYCRILQSDGVFQRCFFDNGKILARRIYYKNGTSEDIHDNSDIAVDPFANRTVLDAIEDQGSIVDIRNIPIEREMAEEIFNTLSGYSLEMTCTYARRYPYDDETYYETETDRCVPGLDMAIVEDGKLWGVAFKTNGHEVLPIASEKHPLHGNWEYYILALDAELRQDAMKVSLRKRSN